MIHATITPAATAAAETLAYFTPVKRGVTVTATPATPAHAALELMFGYYDQN